MGQMYVSTFDHLSQKNYYPCTSSALDSNLIARLFPKS